MASREETLLFLVDVQVRNSGALRKLSKDFAALQAAQDRHMESLQAANRGLIEQGGSGTGGGAGPLPVSKGVNQPGAGPESSIVGVRSRQNPGGRMNPIVVVQESGTAGGLGSLAAGAPNQSAAGGGPSASDIANAISAQNPNVGGPGIDSGQLDQAAEKIAAKVVAPQNDRIVAAIEAQTAATHRLAQAQSGGTAAQAAQDAASRQALAQDMANALAGRRAQMPSPQRTMSTGDAAQVLGRPRTAIREMASTGQIPGASKQQGQWVLPEAEVEKMLEDIEAAKAGGGGTGGGGRPPVALGGAGGSRGGGGGGSRFQWSPFGGSRSNPDSGTSGPLSFANLFKGDGGRGGAFGLPGFGSAGSLGGLGLEHWILTALGIGASATSAIGGASVLGAASLTKSIVGGGADALVNKTTITDAKNYQTQLDALNQAIAVYGKGSKQAAVAQYQLNQTMKDMGGPADVAAIKQLDAQVQTLRFSFDKASAAARVTSAQIDMQVVGLAQAYVPAVAEAAQRNLAIINTGIKPLFTWLEGPQGMGIFKSLENSFAQGLPTTIHAASMAIEDFLRLMQAALPYTGGLSKALDSFFTAKNKEGAAAYDAEVQKLVGDLREWEGLLKLLGQDMMLVFKQDAGTANSIVQALTEMLQKLHNWEESSQGQSQLKTIFAVHKQQILELLTVFEHLASGYGHFYMAVAPSMVTAVTDIAKAFNAVATVIEKIPGGADLLGLGIVTAKLGILMPLLKEAAKWMGVIDVAERAGGGGGGGGALPKLLGAGGGAAGAGAKEGIPAAEGAGGAAGVGGIAKLLAKLGAGGGDSVVTQAMVTDALKFAAVGSGVAAATALGVVLLNHFGTSDQKQATGAAKTASGMPIVNPRVAPFASPTGFEGISKEQIAQYAKDGQQAAQKFVQGMESVKFPSTLSVFESMKQQLNSIPPQARDAAAKTMLEYAQTLQQQGKLPKGAVSNLIQVLEAQFPPLRAYLKKEGLGASQDFASSLSLDKAVSNTKSAVQNLKQEFGNIFDNSTTTSGNMLHQVTKDFSTLKGNMGSLTKQGQVQASQNLAQLKQTALSDATAMEQQVSNKMGILAGNIASGSQSALDSATGSFKALATNIATAVGSGALAAGKGTQLLDEAMNQELKALGAKPIPMVALKSLSISQLLGEQHFITTGGKSNAGHGATAATGALLQIGSRGQAGGDNVPMRVGNTDVVVGAGEQVAVINRHQQPIIDRALAREGYAGLPGLFGSVRTPNYMAGGGFVPGYSEGGVVSVAAPILMGRGFNQIGAAGVLGNAQQESSWNPAAMQPGTDNGGLWGFTSGAKSLPALQAFAAKRGKPWTDVATQTEFLLTTVSSGDISAMNHELSPSAAADWWVTNWEIAAPATANLPNREAGAVSAYDIITGKHLKAGADVGGGGASWSNIGTPQVTGTGAIADLVNAVLGKDAKAINAYGAKQAASVAPAMGTSGGGGTTFPFTYKGKLPEPVQRALEIANAIVAAHPPYVLAGYSPTGTGADGYDCSGLVSSILHAAGVDPAGYMNSFGLADWGEPGRGKYITVGIVNNGADLGEWPNNINHTMMEIAGQYFESSGHGDGPHKDSGFVYPFPIWRHPPGLASGGTVGHKGQYGRIPVPGAAAASGAVLTPAQQAFVKKNKGKPKKATTPPSLTAKHKPSFGKPPKLSDGGAMPQNGWPMAFDATTDLNSIDGLLNAIYAIAGGDPGGSGIPGNGQIVGFNNDISYYTTAWGDGIASPPYPNASGSFFGSFASPSDFVISSTDSSGNTTYSIDPNITTVANQLSQMIGWQGGIVGDLTGASAQAGGVQGPIHKAINARVKEMAKIKTRVTANVKQITAYQKKIADAKNKVAALQKAQKQLQTKQATAMGKLTTTLKQLAAENKKKKPNKATIASLTKQAATQQAAVDGIDGQLVSNIAQQQEITNLKIPGYQADIVPFETENVGLAGKKDSMGSGGEWGDLSTQLGTSASGMSGIGLAEGSGSAATGLYGLLSTVQGWLAAIGGTNGELAQNQLTLTQWQGDYTNLIPGANAALLADNTANAAASNTTNPITGTVAFQFQGQEVLASLLGGPGMAMGGLLPWAGSFMTGGVVPGAIGQSQLAEVHGGEVITNPYLPGAGSGADGGQMMSAMSQLTNALCDHKTAVMQNTTAMKSNTTAVSSSTGAGAGVRYSGGAYSGHTSSDSVVGVGIGS